MHWYSTLFLDTKTIQVIEIQSHKTRKHIFNIVNSFAADPSPSAATDLVCREQFWYGIVKGPRNTLDKSHKLDIDKAKIYTVDKKSRAGYIVPVSGMIGPVTRKLFPFGAVTIFFSGCAITLCRYICSVFLCVWIGSHTLRQHDVTECCLNKIEDMTLMHCIFCRLHDMQALFQGV